MSEPLFSPGFLEQAGPATELTEDEKDILFEEQESRLVEQGGRLFQAQHKKSEFAHDQFAEANKPPQAGDTFTDEPSLIGTESFDDRYSDNTIVQMLTLSGTEVKPDPETGEPNKIKSTVNFLFGDDMAILGMKWDQDGFNFAYDTAMEQWSEHPVMSSISALGLAASFVFPAIGAVRKSAKVGLLARKGLAPTRSILRTAEGVTFSRANEIRTLAKEVNELGKSKFFNPKMAEKIAVATDSEIENMISDKTMKRMLLDDDHMQRWIDLKYVNETGEATPFQQLRYQARTMFSNDWFKMLHSPTRSYIDSMDNFYATAGIGTFLATAPDAKFGKPIYRFLAGIDDEVALRAAGLGDEEIRWAVQLGDEMVSHQEKMLQKGFITQDEFDKFKAFGTRHLPALHKETPGALDFATEETILKAVGKGSGAVKPSKRRSLGKLLSGPTLQQRRKYLTHEDVLADLDRFITDPKDLTIAGLARDKQLYHGYSFLRDLALQAGTDGPLSLYVKNADDILSMSRAAQRQWVSLDEIPVAGAADRLRRMMTKKLGTNVGGKLPYVHRQVIEEFFGHEGLVGQTIASANALEILTSIHKTSRTALNPATHMQNAAGNFFGFLPMAGYNILNPLKAKERLGEGKMISNVFIKAARQINKEKKDIREVFDYENLKRLFTEANGSHTLKASWGDLDLAEMFSHKIMLSTMEESAFESVEGFSHVKKVLEGITKLEDRGLLQGRFAAKKIAEIFTKAASGGKREAALHAMSSAYLGEDVVPKMMYALELAKEGMSIDQVVLEVGRRLPQYQSVGSSIGGLRKMWLPWITFPAEATRIMKNNIMDYPIRMMPWLQLPHIVQGFASGVGISPSLDQVKEIKKGAPQWADKATSVLLNQDIAAPALGGLTGAIVGGLGGMAVGGAPGAVGGAAALGGAGMAVSKMMQEKFGPEDHEDRVRSWVMDFLPWSSILPSSTSEFAEPTHARDFFDLSPVEPLAVLMPLVNTMQGRGSFGSEIRTTGNVDSMSKAALGLMGFVSPPWIQKYGMKVEGPGGVYIPMSDVQEELGGHHVLPKVATGALGAAATGLLLRRAGPVAAAGGALLGGVAGLSMNTRRLMQDVGAMGNPYTQEPGNPIFDLFFNTFAGLPKTWEASPKQRLVNEQFRKRKFSEIRTALTKQFDDAITNNVEGNISSTLERIYKTFLTEHSNPALAQRKFLEWEMRHLKEIGRIPALRGMSEEEILRRMIEASDFAEKHRDLQSKRIVQVLQQELVGRRISRMGSGTKRRRSRY